MVVAPAKFVEAMSEHWQCKLKNTPNEPLKKAWWQMAYAFNRQIVGIGLDEIPAEDQLKEWTVLPLPTGTGKTQGLSLYCSMLPKGQHPGVLIITRLTKEADKLKANINKLAKKNIAVSAHSKKKKKVTAEQMQAAPVLIITHQAFGNALEAVANDDMIKSNWDSFVSWKGGSRKLTVVDESLSMVRPFHVTRKDIYYTQQMLEPLRSSHPIEIKIISEVRKKVSQFSKQPIKGYHAITKDSWGINAEPNFKNLLLAVGSKKFSPVCLDQEETVKQAKKKIRDTICGIDSFLSNWALRTKWNGGDLFSTAYLVLPSFIKKAVVLDATAQHNPVYEFLGDSVYSPKLPDNMRLYKNVTLYVCYDHPVGKTYITAKDKAHFKKLTDYLVGKIGKGKKILFCVHSDTEPLIKPYRRKFGGFKLGHWGAIDGRNDWGNCDTMVIYGLPYYKPVDAVLSLAAFRYWRKQRNKLLAALNSTEEAAASYRIQLLIVNLIQAINRVRCRKVIDEKGNCDKTDIYLFLNREFEGKKIIEGIKQQMPGIEVIPLTDAPTIHLKKDRSKYGDAIIAYLQKLPPGEYPVKPIQKKIGFSKSTLDRLLRKRKDKRNSFAQGLKQIGVEYIPVNGRGAISYFLKTAPNSSA